MNVLFEEQIHIVPTPKILTWQEKWTVAWQFFQPLAYKALGLYFIADAMKTLCYSNLQIYPAH